MKTKKIINKVVVVGGCFDVLHVGHIDFLKKAKSLGDKLIVMLEPDEKVRLLKGPNRPLNSQDIRKKMLLSLRFVDKVIKLPFLTSDDDYGKLIINLKPNIIAVTKGDPIIYKKKSHAELVGAQLVTISKTKTPSTSEIINKLIYTHEDYKKRQKRN